MFWAYELQTFFPQGMNVEVDVNAFINESWQIYHEIRNINFRLGVLIPRVYIMSDTFYMHVPFHLLHIILLLLWLYLLYFDNWVVIIKVLSFLK